MAERMCPKPHCVEVIPRGMFACRVHWFELPQDIRVSIVNAYAKYRKEPFVYADDLIEWQETAQAFWAVGF
jgi:hypothetical protein